MKNCMRALSNCGDEMLQKGRGGELIKLGSACNMEIARESAKQQSLKGNKKV